MDYSTCKKLSKGIVNALEQTEKSALIIASSDMIRFEFHKIAGTTRINSDLRGDYSDCHAALQLKNWRTES